MKFLKRITVISFAVILIAANLPLCASSTNVATEEEQAAGCLPVIQIFGQSHNVQYIFDAETTAENIEMLLDLWGQYTSQVNNAITMDQMYNQILTDNTYQLTQAGYLAFDISAALSGMLTQFWDFVLSGPANMQKVDDQYYEWIENNGIIDPVTIFQKISPYGPVPYLSIPSNNDQGFLLTMQTTYATVGYPTYYGVYGYQGDSNIYAFVVGNSVYMITDNPGVTVKWFRKVYYTEEQTWLYNSNIDSQDLSGTSNGLYYTYKAFAQDESRVYFVPSFDTLNDALSFFAGVFDGTTPIIGSQIQIEPYVNDTEISIPSTSDIPVPISIISDLMPSTGQIEDEADLQAVAQEATEDIFDRQFGIQQATPTPPSGTEVFIPFLPVTLPNFNFNLAGIWHYVRDWIASLGAWFSTVMIIWASLPYAMVVPVYASLVVVIVLGVYKRFFM